METAVYNSADFGIAIFVGVAILIFKFVLKQYQKKDTPKRPVPQPNVSDYSETSEDAIAQMLGEYKKTSTYEEDYLEEEGEIESPLPEIEEKHEFIRDDSYKIKKQKRSTVAKLIDSNDDLRRAVILQEVLSPPLSQRKR